MAATMSAMETLRTDCGRIEARIAELQKQFDALRSDGSAIADRRRTANRIEVDRLLEQRATVLKIRDRQKTKGAVRRAMIADVDRELRGPARYLSRDFLLRRARARRRQIELDGH